MKTLILVKRLRLCHILVRLLYLVSTFPFNQEFQATTVQLSAVTNFLYLPLFLSLFISSIANH